VAFIARFQKAALHSYLTFIPHGLLKFVALVKTAYSIEQPSEGAGYQPERPQGAG
jgi:hypothetical protein